MKAKPRGKHNKDFSDLSLVIAAEWYRMASVKEATGTLPPMDLFSLTAAFNNILDAWCVAVEDGDGTNSPIKIVVPHPPAETKAGLDSYFFDPKQELGRIFKKEWGSRWSLVVRSSPLARHNVPLLG